MAIVRVEKEKQVQTQQTAPPGGGDRRVKDRHGTTGKTGRRGKEHGMSQTQKILMHMQKWGSITALEAMDYYGIMRLASRIRDIKDAGYKVTTTTEEVINRYGERVRCARYRLEGV